MKGGFRRSLAAWGEAAWKIGFFLGLLAGSATLGFLIAWPLWFLATSAKHAYTLGMLTLASACLLAIVIRAIIRGRRARRDSGHPLKFALALVLAFLIVCSTLGGAYTLLVLILRGIWIFAVPGALLWLGLLWLLARARGALNPRKQRRIPAENGSK
jgi:small-conductance mechanosensitive channel